MSTPTHYDTPSRLFHWLTAALVLAAFVLGPEGFGRFMHNGGDPATRWDIVWHETLGMAVLGLTIVRLLWVALRPAPPRFDMPRWTHVASRATHGLLWVLLLALPLTALLTLASEQHPLTLFGGIRLETIPVLSGWAMADGVDWGDVHGFLGDAILWLAGAHAAGALYHHFKLKDGVLRAMLR